ncbi:altered inheritance rate of mitochondria protein 29 [[Candida] jaroonii]|uniref:Altered inheritance rate of mitochondria protein 29 n=1 Tax=[Candida] jaroonii TaxID=467808 RepID=A0ACA9Y407_9ASCO|nr:altered inheritance rate of mitochondria protein 29 [[Candida] jaroonii]
MEEMNVEEPLTSNVRPATDSLLTIRIIKSFPYRNVKNHIIPSINLKETTPKQLFEKMVNIINTTGGLRPYRNVAYDTLKLYTKAHGTKSMNLVINFDNDDEFIILSPNKDDNKSLWDMGIENETEISLFKLEDYLAYKENPEEKW